MQQRLAVASVLVLVLLAGGTAVFIQSQARSQSAPPGNLILPQGQSTPGDQNTQTQTTQNQSTGPSVSTTSSGSSTASTSTNSTSSAGGLLVSGTQTSTCSDDCGGDDGYQVTTTTGTANGTSTYTMDE